MRKEEVNPDMDLTSGASANPSGSPKDTGKKSGGRKDTNPPMDLEKEGIGKETNTGGPIPPSKRVATDPDMDLKKEGATGEPTAKEEKPAVMPGVGNMPTGEKAAKKSTQPE